MEFFSIGQDGDLFHGDSSVFMDAARMCSKKLLQGLIERESSPDRVGHRVAAIRETLDMSKAELADSIGLDRSSLTKIEAGKAGLDIAMAERISVLYDIGLDFIYRGELSDVPTDLRSRLLAELASLRQKS